MKIGFYAGSFDPFTIGHLLIVKKASKMFDKVIIGIGVNEHKKRAFDKEKMKEAINSICEKEKLFNCECIIYEGLTVDKAKELGATFLIRGLRNESDYIAEENLALINEKLSELDTVFYRAGDLGYISSSLVRELLKYKKDVSPFLPKEIYELIEILNGKDI